MKKILCKYTEVRIETNHGITVGYPKRTNNYWKVDVNKDGTI